MAPTEEGRIVLHRLAEAVAAISLATDLGIAEPLERGLRMCLVAVAIARQLGLDEDQVRDVYYATQLAMAGCTASAQDDARLAGDEQSLSRHLHPLFMGPPSGMALAILRHAGEGDPPLHRVRRVVTAMAAMPSRMTEAAQRHCDVANLIARRLGLGGGIPNILGSVFERWDGKGSPNGLRGESIPLGARIGCLAWDLEVQYRLHGPDAALAIIRQRAGGALDPELTAKVLAAPEQALACLEVQSPWSAVLDVEPEPHLQTASAHDAAALGDFTDLKSTYTRGHSRAVSRFAGQAATRLGFGISEASDVSCAGLVHDLGVVAISAAPLVKPGPLSDAVREKVRLHAYWTERVLCRTNLLGRAVPWRACTMSVPTGPAITAVSRRLEWRWAHACSLRPRCSSRCASSARTARRSARIVQPASCAQRLQAASWIPKPARQ